MRKSYDYGHFVVYILALILFSLSFPNLKVVFRRFDQFRSKLELFRILSVFQKFLKNFEGPYKGFWAVSMKIHE